VMQNANIYVSRPDDKEIVIANFSIRENILNVNEDTCFGYILILEV